MPRKKPLISKVRFPCFKTKPSSEVYFLLCASRSGGMIHDFNDADSSPQNTTVFLKYGRIKM
ncbi:hypothetical protein KSP40_PGU007767 [Platanthera guangdongensis]|uniref:Uncharacterized protein n=1 Tax=Platanthera guangdongensis TaxID=2320717 RepID=A0ABR2MB23_9ASPA